MCGSEVCKNFALTDRPLPWMIPDLSLALSDRFPQWGPIAQPASRRLHAGWPGEGGVSSPPAKVPLSTTEAFCAGQHSGPCLFPWNFVVIATHWVTSLRSQHHSQITDRKRGPLLLCSLPHFFYPLLPDSPSYDLTLPPKRQWADHQPHNLMPSFFKWGNRKKKVQKEKGIDARFQILFMAKMQLEPKCPKSCFCRACRNMRDPALDWAAAHPLLLDCGMGNSACVSWQGQTRTNPAPSHRIFGEWQTCVRVKKQQLEPDIEGLVQNRERSTSQLYNVTLLI